VGFGGIFRSLVDIGGNLTLVGFGGIPRLVESGGFFRRGVDSRGNFRLVDPDKDRGRWLEDRCGE